MNTVAEIQSAYDTLTEKKSVWRPKESYREILKLPPICYVTVGHKDDWLDVGCGTGEMLEVARERGFGTYGIDLSPVTVEKCRANNFTRIEVAPMETFDFGR